MKKLLFVVSGLGLGNSTRCHSIIAHLAPEKYRCHVATSGNGLAYFQNLGTIERIVKIRPLKYGKSNGKLSFWKTMLLTPWIVWILLINQVKLLRLARAEKYDAFIIDSDYSIWWIKFLMGAPVVALNNADVVIEESKRAGNLSVASHPQLLIELLDQWFHKLVPDYVLSPALFKKADSAKIRHFPPFIRPGLSPTTRMSRPKKVLVMLSGSSFAASPRFLEDISNHDGLEFRTIGCNSELVYGNHELLNTADILIVNGGFSAVSEAVCLKKPVIVMPIANHAEQAINALLVEESGFGWMATESNIGEKFARLLANYEMHLAAYDKKGIPLNGAQMAGEFIESVLQ